MKDLIEVNMKNRIARECDIKELVGKVMGHALIKAPIEQTQHYECAAWHETAVSESGVVVPLTLVEGYHHPHDLTLDGSVPGKIKDNYFQSLWCGNAIGESYDTKKDEGKPKDVSISVPLFESLEYSFKINKDYHEIYVSRDHLDLIEEYYQKKFEDARDYMSKLIAEHREFGNGGERQSEYACCATSIGYSGGQLQGYAKIIDRINFLKGRYGGRFEAPEWMKGN